MAVTGHWIETKIVHTAKGPHHILKLHSELIAFHHLEGRHSGSHLAETFVSVLERYKVTKKVYKINMLYQFNIWSNVLMMY